MIRIRMAILFGLGLSSGLGAQSARSGGPDTIGEVVSAAHDNGYRQGFLEGRRTAPGADRLAQCNAAMDYTDRRARRAGEYESCLRKLQFASTQGVAYFREVASECVAMLP